MGEYVTVVVQAYVMDGDEVGGCARMVVRRDGRIWLSEVYRDVSRR